MQHVNSSDSQRVYCRKNPGPWISVACTSLDLMVAHGDLYRRQEGTIFTNLKKYSESLSFRHLIAFGKGYQIEKTISNPGLIHRSTNSFHVNQK